jgi:hypothetical protein
MRPTPASFLLALCTLLAATPAASQGAGAMEAGGAVFGARMLHANHELALRSVGVLTRLFFRAYATALYLPDGVAADRWRDDVAKSLEIEYFLDIGAERFGPAGDAVLARMHDEATLAPLRERIERLNAAYVDVRKGDRYTLTYAPGAGTTLAHNGRPLVTIDGADFAAVYFSIWLGDDPVDARLRDQLLAGAPQ